MDSMTDLGRERLWTHARLLTLTADFDGRIVAANPAWTDILGWPVDQILGTSFFDLIHPDDLERTVTEAGLMREEGKQVPRFQNRYRTADGPYRDIDWTAVSDGQFIHALGRDNTDERVHADALTQAEEAMRQAQKMEAIGQFTGGVAHDFNNLLTVIKGAADLLLRPNLPEERRIKFVHSIGDTADRAVKLTAQLLAFARRQTLKSEVFDVGASIDELASMIPTLTGSRVDLVIKLPSEPLLVLADRSQLDTAVVNMAINARDAMEGDGLLTIGVSAASTIPAHRAHPILAGDFVEITVVDTGSGISENNLLRIFEPFFTTKDVGYGTGLGLSQVFGFAKQSGGDVRVESAVGKGTIFSLYLPRTRDAGAIKAAPAADSLIDGEGICVLLVEDNADVGEFAANALRELGYDSILVPNAEEAFAEVSKDPARFHVVFTDIVMPGMSGIDLAELIRSDYPNIPVILTSGYSQALVKNGDCGFELLQKPYSVGQLSTVLSKAIAWHVSQRKV